MRSGASADSSSGASARARVLLARLGDGAGRRAQALLRAFVRRSDDRRLERTLGSDRGLAILFGAMARRFDPAAAEGFRGEVTYELLGMDGLTRDWTLAVDGKTATVRRGVAPEPALTVRLGLADLVRLAVGDLDPGAALLSGRLDLEGDLSVALRLGAMFGTDSGLGES